VHGAKISVGRRLHGKQRNDLEEVVLDHVAQTTGGFVKRSAVPDTEILGKSYLNAGHVVAVPNRLEKELAKRK